MSQVVLVTGMSGAGRTTALKALEDLGYEAVDNLPVALLAYLIRSGEPARPSIAIGIDCRTRAFDPASVDAMRDALPEGTARVLFLDCDDEILRRRFTETRRRHPLAAERPVLDGIQRERALTAALRERADLVIDTSQLAPSDLRGLIAGHFQTDGDLLRLSVVSFAYRHGVPREADLVFDVRFLANPHYVDELRPRHGLDPAVRRYVQADPGYALLLRRLGALPHPNFANYSASPIFAAFAREMHSTTVGRQV